MLSSSVIFTAVAAVALTPMWEAEPRWICRAEQMHSCDANACTNAAGVAVFQIDFGDGTFRPLGSDKKFTEHVSLKKSFGSLGYSKVGLDSGDSIQFALQPEEVAGIPTKGRKFSSSRGMYPEIVTYFGTCFPSD